MPLIAQQIFKSPQNARHPEERRNPKLRHPEPTGRWAWGPSLLSAKLKINFKKVIKK